jgi:chaperonin GroEL
LVLNRLKGVFNTLAIKAPAFGDRRKAILQDIAVLTGATVITEEQGITFENATVDMLGSARKIIAGKDDTTIIEGYGDPKAVEPGSLKSRPDRERHQRVRQREPGEAPSALWPARWP